MPREHKTERQIPESTYLRHLHRSKDAGNYFLFFRLYYKILPRLTALFLQDVINLASMSSTRKEVVDGKEMFLCSEKYLSGSMSEWTEWEQRDHFEKLKKKGYLVSKLRGIPSKRWIWVDLAKIEADLDEAMESEVNDEDPNSNGPAKVGGNTPTQVRGKPRTKDREEPRGNNKGITYPSYTDKESLRRTPPSGGDRVLFSETNGHAQHSTNGHAQHSNRNGYASRNGVVESPARKLSRLLHDGLATSGRLACEPNITTWDKQFARLLSVRSFAHIESHIRDHCRELKNRTQYWPQCYCAKTFVDRFARIEEAVLRLDQTKGPRRRVVRTVLPDGTVQSKIVED